MGFSLEWNFYILHLNSFLAENADSRTRKPLSILLYGSMIPKLSNRGAVNQHFDSSRLRVVKSVNFVPEAPHGPLIDDDSQHEHDDMQQKDAWEQEDQGSQNLHLLEKNDLWEHVQGVVCLVMTAQLVTNTLLYELWMELAIGHLLVIWVVNVCACNHCYDHITQSYNLHTGCWTTWVYSVSSYWCWCPGSFPWYSNLWNRR